MKISLFHILFVALSFTLIANGMKENSKPIILDFMQSKQSIISRVWKVDRVILNDTINRTSDFKSYQFEFKDNGKYVLIGPEKPVQGTWEFTANETKLLLNKNTPNQEIVDIVLLNKSQLQLEYQASSEITGLQKANFILY